MKPSRNYSSKSLIFIALQLLMIFLRREEAAFRCIIPSTKRPSEDAADSHAVFLRVVWRKNAAFQSVDVKTPFVVGPDARRLWDRDHAHWVFLLWVRGVVGAGGAGAGGEKEKKKKKRKGKKGRKGKVEKAKEWLFKKKKTSTIVWTDAARL